MKVGRNLYLGGRSGGFVEFELENGFGGDVGGVWEGFGRDGRVLD